MATQTEVTKEQKKAVVEVIMAVAEAVRAAGKRGIPSGHLYSILMPYNITLNDYQNILHVLKAGGLVSEASHLLLWVGPSIAK